MVEDSSCPTCKQAVIIPEQDKLNNKLKMSDLLDKIESSNSTMNIQKFLISTNLATITKWKKAKAEHDFLVSRLVELNEEESTLKIKQIKTKLEDLAASTNPYVQTLADVDKTIAETQLGISTWQEKLVTIIEEEESIVLWEKAYAKDLRLLLYDRVCPFLAERANHHLQALNNSQITVNFSTTAQMKDSSIKEEFSSTALSSTGGGSYSLLSGGEQQMVDFSVGLALADLAATQVRSRSNLLILDEPFVGLDDRNSESIISYLKEELAKIKSTIFLVSNEETLKGLVPNRVHVEKENGISQVIY
jgi:DNA repair exonuclease SbcCD ATPase subunit